MVGGGVVWGSFAFSVSAQSAISSVFTLFFGLLGGSLFLHTLYSWVSLLLFGLAHVALPGLGFNYPMSYYGILSTTGVVWIGVVENIFFDGLAAFPGLTLILVAPFFGH